jgi:hypothetical protein
MMRRLFGAMSLVGVLVVAGPAADAAAASRLTKIQSPGADHLVGSGQNVRVAVRSRASLDALTISVDGRNVTRSFRRSNGAYRATLRPGQLHPGVNQLSVKTRNYKDFDHVRFIVARRVPNLLKLTDVVVAGPSAPVRAQVRVRRGAELRAWLNGRRVDRAFRPAGRSYVGRLGANDGVRRGRNRLVVLVHRVHRAGRSAVHDVESTTFRIRPRQVIAGAGRDRVVDAGDLVQLRGRAVGAGGDVDYRWEIVDAPEGGEGAEIEDADTASPELVPTAPGTYRLRATVRAADRTSGAGRIAQAASSADTITVDARTKVPPIGWRLNVGFDERGTIVLDQQAVPDTTKCIDPAIPRCTFPFITYAVFERSTLLLKESGTRYYDGAEDDVTELARIAASYARAPGHLMVFSSSSTTGDNPSWPKLMDALGVGNGSAARDRKNRGPVSIVGVPGSPPGSAFVSAPYCGSGCDGLPPHEARIAGYLRLNAQSADGRFELVPTDQVEFNTALAAPAGQVKMSVGHQIFTGTAPTDGSSGFFLVTLSSRTLAPLSQDVFVTNTPGGAQFVSAAVRMGDAIAAAVQGDDRSRGSVLVLLQAFGSPKSSGGWMAGKQAIETMGGNGQVFAQMNRFFPDSPDQGRYAFAGRARMDASAAESSESLGKLRNSGTLHGMLARGRDLQYEPIISGPAGPRGSINFELVSILNRPTPPGGGFPTYTEGKASAMEYLGRVVMKICATDQPTCDVREAYHSNMAAAWDTKLTILSLPSACPETAPAPYTFSKTDCEPVRKQLVEEVSDRNTVANHFAQLQKPFGAGTQVTALVDIASLAHQIETDVQPPPADNAASRTLNIIGTVVKVAGMAGGQIEPGIGKAANGVAGALGAAAYLLDDKGSPDVIGPQVEAQASQLGTVVAKRLDAASAYFTTEARIVLSDWTKMQEVAEKADGDWNLGDIDSTTTQLRRATRQSIYQSLVPVAWPMLYDLGYGIKHATDWLCYGESYTVDKRLFQHTGAGAEVLYEVSSEEHLIAVGAERATGSKTSAYVPAPSQELTSRLFRDPDDPTGGGGGIGLSKLQFYSPQNFRLFPKSLQQSVYPEAPQYNHYFSCQSMPNPPGNSG